MRKAVSLDEFRSRLNEHIEAAHRRGEHIVVEVAGRPLVALVPAAIADNYAKKGRARFFALLEEVAARHPGKEQETIAHLIAQAAEALRCMPPGGFR